jgi:hypothetical protein
MFGTLSPNPAALNYSWASPHLTVAQMARLQGQLANRRWESGRLEVSYAKSNGQWKITAFKYQATEALS